MKLLLRLTAISLVTFYATHWLIKTGYVIGCSSTITKLLNGLDEPTDTKIVKEHCEENYRMEIK